MVWKGLEYPGIKYKNKEHRTYTAEYKIAVIEEYLKSDVNERSFAKEKGLPLSTLRSWLAKTNKVRVVSDDNMTLVDVTEQLTKAMNAVTVEKKSISLSINGFRVEVDSKDLPYLLRCMGGIDA